MAENGYLADPTIDNRVGSQAVTPVDDINPPIIRVGSQAVTTCPYPLPLTLTPTPTPTSKKML